MAPGREVGVGCFLFGIFGAFWREPGHQCMGHRHMAGSSLGQCDGHDAVLAGVFGLRRFALPIRGAASTFLVAVVGMGRSL